MFVVMSHTLVTLVFVIKLCIVQHGAEDLFFCFRWLLVSFKREFNYEDVMRIWEVQC